MISGPKRKANSLASERPEPVKVEGASAQGPDGDIPHVNWPIQALANHSTYADPLRYLEPEVMG